MNMDKNLRDIWSNADKEYIDAMKENGNFLNNPQETNQTISFNDWCDAQEGNSGTLLKSDKKNSLHSQQAPNRSELKKHVSNHLNEVIISNASLWSIWAPTVKDDLNKKDDSQFTFKFCKQDASDPKSLMRKETNGSWKAFSSDSESELSNNCGSQESEDELNEETFGKFAAIPEEFRPNNSDLSDLSEATLLWDSQLKNNGGIVVSNNNQQPISNLPRSDRRKSEITEINSQNSSKKEIMLPPPLPENKSIRKNGQHQENFANSDKSVVKYKTFDAKFESNHNAVAKENFLSEKERKNSSNACHVNISDHTLDYEIVNFIPGKKTHAIRKPRIKKYSSNSQKNRRIPSKVNYKETLEIETREIIDREGNAQRLTRQKITYVEGRMIDQFPKSQNTKCDKIKWNTNINLPTIKKQSRNIRSNNMGGDNSTGNITGYHRRFSVDNPTSSHIDVEHANIQHEDPVKNNGGARPKNRNAYKRYNSYTNTDIKSDINISDYKERFSEDTNRLSRRPNTDFNSELFNQGKTDGSNHMERFRTDNLEKETNGLIRNKLCTKEYENRVSWNIIDSENDEEQNISKPYSIKIKNPSNNVAQNDYPSHDSIAHEKDNKMTSSRVKNIPKNNSVHTNPKVTELRNNNLLKGTNCETNKFKSFESDKLSLSSDLKNECEQKKSKLIKYAKDVADLIVGSQTALSVLKSQYDEWEVNRRQSINILEQIINLIKNSSNRGKTIKNIFAAINVAVAVGDAVIPNKAVTTAMRIVATVIGAFANFAGKSLDKKDLEDKAFEIKELFQRDIDASSLLYIYGIQCNTQFQETCSIIRKFHQSIQSENYVSATDDEVVKEFLSEISEYNPLSYNVFYKRLKLCYEKLMLGSKSKDSKAFCRVFEDVPEAVDVINLLPYTFNMDGFDHTIVHPYWEEIFSFLYESESTDIKIFLRKVEECLFFLKKERDSLKRCVSIFFKEERSEKEK